MLGGIQQTQVVECSVCGSHETTDVSKATYSGKYSDCPCCGRRVGDPSNKNYQARARRWNKEHK